MSATFEFTFESTYIGRSLSDVGWEEIDAAHLEYWKLASRTLSSRSFDWREYSALVEVDWRPWIRRHERHLQVMRQLYDAAKTPAASNIAKRFPTGLFKVPVKLTMTSGSYRKGSAPSEVVESYLHDTFLIMNLAAPGSCNFYNAVLGSKLRKTKDKVSLSELNFDEAFLDGRKGKWPAPQLVPIDAVTEWFDSVRSGTSQVPRNRMEKVLFALLHISKADQSPMAVIWLCYAFETLFDTKPGSNFRTLVDRMEVLLSPNAREAKSMRRNLRLLYDVRSSFVHGGLEAVHPMHNEVLDQDVMKAWERLNEPTVYGFRLLLCAVQTVIERHWKWPQFKEVLCEGSEAY